MIFGPCVGFDGLIFFSLIFFSSGGLILGSAARMRLPSTFFFLILLRFLIFSSTLGKITWQCLEDCLGSLTVISPAKRSWISFTLLMVCGKRTYKIFATSSLVCFDFRDFMLPAARRTRKLWNGSKTWYLVSASSCQWRGYVNAVNLYLQTKRLVNSSRNIKKKFYDRFIIVQLTLYEVFLVRTKMITQNYNLHAVNS